MTTLSGVLPETQTAFDGLDRLARSLGMSIAIANFGGLRSQADTTRILQYRTDDFNAAVRAGQIRPDTTLQRFRPIAPFGSSYHNYGAAFDIVVDAWPSSFGSRDKALATLGAHAAQFGLRWGGKFTNPDTPHFELAIPLADAQARYKAFAASGGGSLFSLPFDLAGLLPGASSAPDDTPTLDDTDTAGDDAGELVFDELPRDTPPVSLMLLGLAVAGVVAWALRRKFT